MKQEPKNPDELKAAFIALVHNDVVGFDGVSKSDVLAAIDEIILTIKECQEDDTLTVNPCQKLVGAALLSCLE